jgi:hypothetical protein
LRENQIHSQGVLDFSKGALLQMKKLEYLDLDFGVNSVNDAGIASLGSALKYLITLQHLKVDLERNQVSRMGMTVLADGISAQMKHLKSLSINLGKCELDSQTIEVPLCSSYVVPHIQTVQLQPA